MKHSISLSMFSYKPRLIIEVGFSLRVVYLLNYVFGIQIRSFTYKRRGFLPGDLTCGIKIGILHIQWIINGLLNDDIVLQDNSDYVLILRMIQLGLNSWSMMDTATFKEKKVSLMFTLASLYS